MKRLFAVSLLSAIAVVTGDYTVDETALAAARRLRTQHPHAEIWFVRIGHRALHHIGAGSTPDSV